MFYYLAASRELHGISFPCDGGSAPQRVCSRGQTSAHWPFFVTVGARSVCLCAHFNRPQPMTEGGPEKCACHRFTITRPLPFNAIACKLPYWAMEFPKLFFFGCEMLYLPFVSTTVVANNAVCASARTATKCARVYLLSACSVLLQLKQKKKTVEINPVAIFEILGIGKC